MEPNRTPGRTVRNSLTLRLRYLWFVNREGGCRRPGRVCTAAQNVLLSDDAFRSRLTMQTPIPTGTFASDDLQDTELPTRLPTISLPRRTSAAGTFQSPVRLSNEDSWLCTEVEPRSVCREHCCTRRSSLPVARQSVCCVYRSSFGICGCWAGKSASRSSAASPVSNISDRSAISSGASFPMMICANS